MIWVFLLVFMEPCWSQVCNAPKALDYTHVVYMGLNYKVSKVTINPSGVSSEVTVVDSTYDSAPLGFWGPTVMAVSKDNTILSLDDNTGVIRNINPATGTYSVFVGTRNSPTMSDGVGTAATFYRIGNMEWERDATNSKLWVTSYAWNQIRQVVRTTSTSSTVYWSPTSGLGEGTTTGVPLTGQLSGGYYWRSRDFGYWLIWDSVYRIMRKLHTSDGYVENVLGPYVTMSRDPGCVDGTGTNARLTHITRIQFPFNSENFAYILESNERVIRKVTWTFSGSHTVTQWYGTCAYPKLNTRIMDFAWASTQYMYLALETGISRLDIGTKTQTLLRSIETSMYRVFAIYLGPNTCIDCPAGTYGLNDVCTPCGPNSYCTGSVMYTCQTCGPNKYETGACTSTTNRQCTDCSACGPNKYETGACTSTTNRQCTDCRAACTGESYETTACSGSNNRVCSTCTPPCSGGTFASVACTSMTNRVCTPCKSCTGDTYKTGDCTSTTDTACATCTACAPGKFQTAPCTSTTDRVCSTCASCSPGSYETTACTSTSNRACSTCATCSPGSYETVACTGTTNRVCSPCTAACTGNNYETGACTSTSNRVCSTCASCSPGSYETTPCTSTANRACSTCATCSPGSYETTPCTSTTNRACSTCATCSPGSYETTACTSTSNRVCTSCAACTAGFYETGSCTSTTNRVCSPCTAARTGNNYETTACTSTTNRACSTCLTCTAGKYETSPCTSTSNRACTDCTTCPAGKYEISPCTATTNRGCQSCAPGEFDIVCGCIYGLMF